MARAQRSSKRRCRSWLLRADCAPDHTRARAAPTATPPKCILLVTLIDQNYSLTSRRSLLRRECGVTRGNGRGWGQVRAGVRGDGCWSGAGMHAGLSAGPGAGTWRGVRCGLPARGTAAAAAAVLVAAAAGAALLAASDSLDCSSLAERSALKPGTAPFFVYRHWCQEPVYPNRE
ncbi:hypothetical protein ACJJTC_004145 [Scirpophaga incertulas]